MNKIIFIITLIVCAFTITACSTIEPKNMQTSNNTITNNNNHTQIANPASKYCIENNGTLDIRTIADGSQVGYCIFSNGLECEEWKFMRGECTPTHECKTDTKLCPDGSTVIRTGVNCEFTKCLEITNSTNNTIPCSIDFSASNFNSSMYPYLSSYIELGTSSDWINYAPLKRQVQILISGLDSDEAKAKTIGSWVSNSKPYSYAFENGDNPNGSVANNFGSIIQIYDSREGVCMDAAIMTVAMLREANIPSRVMYPKEQTNHIKTQAYINDKWITLDSTFGLSQQGLFPYDILVYPFSATTAYLGKYDNMNQYFDEYTRIHNNISTDTYVFKTIIGDLPAGEFEYRSIPKGISVTDDISSKDILSDYFLDFDLTRIDSKKIWCTSYNNSCTLSEIKPSDICSNGMCYVYQEVSTINVLRNNFPRVLIKDLAANTYSTGAIMSADFIGKIKLPIGKYRFYVTIRNSGNKQELAYADINIVENERFTFSQDLLKLSDGADKNDFDALIARYNVKLDCELTKQS